MEGLNLPPFYVGQRVVCVHKKCGFVYGNEYVISHCEYKENPSNLGNWHWYVGIPGAHDWLAPYLFAPINETFQSISLERILEEETKFVSVN